MTPGLSYDSYNLRAVFWGSNEKRSYTMSVLVTGCAGFIGSVVCRMLLDNGQSVVGVDNLNDAYDVRLKHWRLEQTQAQSRFQFAKLDISDHSALHALFTESKDADSSPFSGVINLGARAGVRPSVEDPWAYYQSNTIGTLNLLELCCEFGVEKFVHASTSSVYGAGASMPFKEDSTTSRPLSPYAASKKAAETLAYSHHHLFGLDVSVLRYFTVYGPAGRPDMSVFRFIRAISEGETITVFGDGKQTRDFTYVDDVARGTLAALTPLGYEIINIGNDYPMVLADVITMIEELLNKKARIEYADMHPADMQATWADIQRAETLLGWRPQVTIEAGIQNAVQWYLDNRDWARDIK